MYNDLTTHSPVNRLQVWLESTRPGTLTLAFASILCGSALAAWKDQFNLPVALLALITAVLLQTLCNMANDYGDMLKGTDDPQRIGPLRALQRGLISTEQMRRALVLCTLLSALSGLALITLACHGMADIIGFSLLGMLAIIAAITYTVGRYAYGYLGLGDLSVLLFFGWLGVGGSYYLQTGTFEMAVLLPATACGLLITAVLNINNLRDIETDPVHGKNTLAVHLGPRRGRFYHLCLLSAAMLCLALFAALYLKTWSGWLFLLAMPMLFSQARDVWREQTAAAMRPMLKRTVRTSLLTCALFAIGTALA